MHRLLLPNVCNFFVSRNASVSVARRRLLAACRDLSTNSFLSNFWSLHVHVAILKRIYRTKFGIVMFIFNGEKFENLSYHLAT